MPLTTAPELADLPQPVAAAITDFVQSALDIFGPDLRSVVLYGSAAEGRLRPASDVNLILVFSTFDPAKAVALRTPYAAGEAAVRLTAMFLLESELPSACELFAQKFSDVLRRHCVLHGPDPFSDASIPRPAVIIRLRQVLLNLALRLREAYVKRGSAPDRLSLLIADSAGPLRSCAATLRELEGQPTLDPKEALSQFALSLGEPGWDAVLTHLSETRERTSLSPDDADATLLRLIDLSARLRARADALR